MKKKNCLKCDSEIIEIKKGLIPFGKFKGEIHELYPKPIPFKRKNYNERRYFCPNCKKEWIYDTLSKEWSEVEDNSQFLYDEEKGYLVLNPKWTNQKV